MMLTLTSSNSKNLHIYLNQHIKIVLCLTKLNFFLSDGSEFWMGRTSIWILDKGCLKWQWWVPSITQVQILQNSNFPPKGCTWGCFHDSLERGGGEETWLWTEAAEVFYLEQSNKGLENVSTHWQNCGNSKLNLNTTWDLLSCSYFFYHDNWFPNSLDQ